ncbi:HNH endonuclease [Marinicauda algicola]|uniref:Putative HNH nuclease YajD n=1 Tax=Marinicauda algicola TaxID=2029849 RepID=A0A4S2GWF7_9PROT|nr:HNH endonuclease [Marinicauda algicola]TGY87344.1 HNH endonuclease [Marinicauda algicola]
MARRTQRSPEAERYRRLYKTAAWMKARLAQLARQPLCERCRRRGIVRAATVVNHRVPHKGDWSLFIDPENHESACAPCHDGEIQSAERLGYSKSLAPDGTPTDPAHPWNAD